MDNVTEELRRCRKIKEVIAFGIKLTIQFAQSSFQSGIHQGIGKIATMVREPLLEELQDLRTLVARLQERGDLIAELLEAKFIKCDSHDGKILWQQPFLRQVEKSGNQLAFSQIARSAKQHQHTAPSGLIDWALQFALDCNRCHPVPLRGENLPILLAGELVALFAMAPTQSELYAQSSIYWLDSVLLQLSCVLQQRFLCKPLRRA